MCGSFGPEFALCVGALYNVWEFWVGWVRVGAHRSAFRNKEKTIHAVAILVKSLRPHTPFALRACLH